MRTIFVDLDNTLAANNTCDNVEYTKRLYLDKKPIKIAINAINYLYRDDNIIIMSRYVGEDEGRQEKIEWMKKYLPDKMIINAPFLISSNDNLKKVDYILDYAFMNNVSLSDIIIIDDKKDILQDCKAHNITSLYPQQVIVEYEEVLENDKIK
jgi:5'(3')-deoxyribonucleotidase